ncbi:penicillin-binding transpeptidase domain-containing protein [Spongiactinospora sp. TRM90649]|uniref:penicillin-binding transpeptidase domain-containing protein n=1 Tax=Spongiactinospora sp. TRM90649 TaxID=3031114 RepID=UPI0023F8DD29|nr:penicillin-binding transpeptidase domain-containing protein [Spongiactinospora sp. TRM90649]MDF5751123.1 penicillin-binding transpeptidase domain-containing protein [Spongiactinospora sp. TRM90649]
MHEQLTGLSAAGTPPRRRRRGPWTVIAVTALVAVLVSGGVLWALRTQGSPGETAEQYLAAWARKDYAAMRALSVDPPADFDRWHRSFGDGLKLTSAAFRAGESEDVEDGAEVGFHATLAGTVNWSYGGALRLVEHERAWRVAWTPAAIHPELRAGRSIKAVTVQPELAPITAAGGERIDTSTAPGSVQQLVQGLQETYRGRLTGSASGRIVLYEGKETVKTLAKTGARKGEPLATTIDLRVHEAGAKALDQVKKPASLVALRPSTGEVLAAVNKPGGFNRALLGKYPPGSTFKVVTASALVAGGVEPDKSVNCPPERNIGGFRFHNAGFHDYGTLSFRDAFAHSCNTTFGELSVKRLDGGRLGQVAAGFGFGAPITPGVPAVRAEFPVPKDATDLASAGIGQGRVLASPLNMAAVAAAIADGTWRPPRLVAGKLVPEGGAQPRKVEDGVVRALRDLMPAVVSEGTAESVRFPKGTAGKTGTAEYGLGKEPPAHSWFVGYQGDLAFAVIVEGGGAGAAVAAPIAARFLSALN